MTARGVADFLSSPKKVRQIEDFHFSGLILRSNYNSIFLSS
jgi:hypothetical protein